MKGSLIYSVGFLVCAVASLGLHADAIHRGSISPLAQGWTIEPDDEGGPSYGSAVTADPDYPEISAWEVNDSGSGSGDRLRYRRPGPNPQDAWSLRAKFRVVSGANPSDAASLLEVDNGSRRYLILFGLNANNDLLVEHRGSTHVEPNAGSPASDYNTIEISFRANVAHLFINGVQIFGQLSALNHAATRVNFGSGSSTGQARTRYAWVDWSIGEPACDDGLDNNHDGLTDFSGGDSNCLNALDPSEGLSPFLPKHSGKSDPLTEGFRGTPPSGSAKAIQQPEPAWEIEDSSTTEAPFRYQLWPQSSDDWEAAWSAGWTLDLRLGNPDAGPVNAASFVEVRRGDLRYSISFGVTASQDEARVNGSATNAVVCPDHLAQRDWQLSHDGATASLSSPGCGSVAMIAEVSHPFEEGLSFGSGSVGSTNKTQFAKVELKFADADNDNLDAYGELILGTSPSDDDSDDDLLLDGYEGRYGLDPLVADDASLDPDNDTFSTLTEQIYQTNPLSSDTDNDELSDPDEVNIHQSNPLLADTDGDGLTDGEEINLHQTNPNKADTDDDDLSDFDEVNVWNTDPTDADTDGDGRNDGIEVANNTNPLSAAETEILRQFFSKEGTLPAFGFEVSIDGDFAAVAGRDANSIRLAIPFRRDPNGMWQEESVIFQPDPIDSTLFADRVRVSGERILITANYEDGPLPTCGGCFRDWAGAAHIYERQSDGSWPRVAHLTAPVPDVTQRFGFSADLDGDTAMVNTWRYDGFEASTIFFYERQTNGSWTLQDEQRLASPQRVYSMDMEGSNAVYFIYGGSNPETRAYERINGDWAPSTQLETNHDVGSLTGYDQSVIAGDFAFVRDADGVLKIHQKLGANNWVIVKTFTIDDFDVGAGETANIGQFAASGNKLVLENRASGGNRLILFEYDPAHGWNRTATLASTTFDHSLRSLALSGLNLVAGEINELAWFMRLSEDFDGDGLTNLDEVNIHSSGPHLEDSDLDGLLDGDEVNVHGTKPNDDDTDDDSFSDGDEVAAGSDPLDPNSTPESSVLQIPVLPGAALVLMMFSLIVAAYFRVTSMASENT